MCTSQRELERFEGLFARFWEGVLPPELPTPPRRQTTRASQTIPLLMLANQQMREKETEPGNRTTGASSVERLLRVDFSEVGVGDQENLQKLAERLWRQMSRRLSRRLKQQGRRGEVNWRRVIRRSLSAGGEPIHLLFSSRKRRRPRLVMLLDVSGSDARDWSGLLPNPIAPGARE